MKIELNNEIKTVFETLKSNGYECFMVGGCVRDFLLNKNPNDIDFTTNATPEQIKECFKNFHYFDKGIKHGTVAIKINSIEFEITTYRTDGKYIDNRRPEKVIFVSNINDDLSRRDFTINAIAYNPEIGFVDNFNGINDLNSRIIKCVNNPLTRFEEDALRILRALRFSATLDFEIEEKTKLACFESAKLLNNISKERVRDEFFKTITQPSGLKNIFEYIDIWGVAIPKLFSLKHNKNSLIDNFSRLSNLKNNLIFSKKNDLAINLSLLFFYLENINKITIDNPKNNFNLNHFNNSKLTKSILENLHTNKKTINEVLTIIKYKNTVLETNKTYIKKLCYEVKNIEQVKKIISFKYLLDNIYNKESDNDNDYLKIKNIILEIEKENLSFTLKDLDINGDDLKKLNIQEKQIGKILQYLLNAVLNEEIENKKNILIEYIKKMELN